MPWALTLDNQKALNGILAETQAPTNSIQRQLKSKNNPGANTVTTANNQGARVSPSRQNTDWSSGGSVGRSNSNYSSSSEVNRSNQSQRETGPGYRWIRTQPVTVINKHWRSKSSAIDLLKTKLNNELSRYCDSKYGGSIEYSTVRFTNGTLESKRVYDDVINHKGTAVGEGFCRVSRYNKGYDSLSFCPAGPQNKFCPTATEPSKGIDSEFFIGGVEN